MTTDQRKILALHPIVWAGDLLDDCTAEWAGLMLRAEEMDKGYWWWAVYDMQRKEITVDNSNEYTGYFIDGDAARKKAESIAKEYITIISGKVVAKYCIANTFKVTGRGLVFGGYITEGSISPGDTIEFTAFEMLRHRKIAGVGGLRTADQSQVNTGLLIQCKNEEEIEELRMWEPDNEISIITSCNNCS